MAGLFVGGADASVKDLNFIGAVTNSVYNEIVAVFKVSPDTAGAILTIALGIAMLIE